MVSLIKSPNIRFTVSQFVSMREAERTVQRVCCSVFSFILSSEPRMVDKFFVKEGDDLRTVWSVVSNPFYCYVSAEIKGHSVRLTRR